MKRIAILIPLSIAGIFLIKGCISNESNVTSTHLDASPGLSEKDLARSKELGCNVTITPRQSFSSAFNKMKNGQLLCLQDGVYKQIMDIPSEINVRALNDGQAEIDGRGIDAGWKAIVMLTGDNSSVRGLKVHHASNNAKACLVGGNNNRFQVMSCSHGGKYKHAIPMSISGKGHLIENSWFYGEGRYLLMCYLGNEITIRKNVFRWDKTKPGEANEPNASMSNYSCSDMIWENNISLDYGVPETRMKHCGDICMSTTEDTPNYNVKYLGNIIINHSKDTDNNKALRADQKAHTPSSNIIIKDLYVRDADVGIAINPIYENITVENCTMLNVSRKMLIQGVSSICTDDADIKFSYIDGVKTNIPLWPWPNETLIKRDMCDKDERQSDWCTSGKSLTNYVLNP